MGRPRKPLALGPLGGASERLQLLEKAGLNPTKAASLIRKFLEQAEAALEGAMNPLKPDQPDYHARMAAGKIILQLLGANPPKTSAPGNGPTQVAVMIEMPKWAQPGQAKVIQALPAKPAE